VIARAGVSEPAFFEFFGSVEDCFLAAFEEGLERLSRVVGVAVSGEVRWLSRLRAGVVALLGFLDDERGWGRLLILEGPEKGAVALRCEQRVLGVLVGLLEEGAPRVLGGPFAPSSQMTAELVAGGVLAVVRSQMAKDDGGALVALAPSLMAFIVAPYLGQTAARAELMGSAGDGGSGGFRELPIRVTRRTMLVLRAVARAPGSSNREIATAAGLVDEGQASKLLRRLATRGLIENVGVGALRGEPNAWLLTPYGDRVVALAGEAFAKDSPRVGRARGAGDIG
jgi:AcrR family transcriptional regulator